MREKYRDLRTDIVYCSPVASVSLILYFICCVAYVLAAYGVSEVPKQKHGACKP